ncbi:hypothetical protein IT6_03350 [Methylacidiphilum caldifontis]|uniref:hypothetical protein n=1 Tax=Methylacidiphilum caldifontis TaxID=2795386 RepID=UPI001A8DEB10|nr:hypothetical protein [Methylacidiphilum caldifontis]QSR89329.1 hypothetical protein IT6_03350 [Methylacidiphilum caldifontis]
MSKSLRKNEEKKKGYKKEEKKLNIPYYPVEKERSTDRNEPLILIPYRYSRYIE